MTYIAIITSKAKNDLSLERIGNFKDPREAWEWLAGEIEGDKCGFVCPIKEVKGLCDAILKVVEDLEEE